MKIDQEVLNVISSGEIEGTLFKITGGQLDRKTYLGVNEVLENIGGKWNRKFKGHVFEEDPTEKIDNVLLTGETISEKKLYQFFETPKELAQRMVELAEIKDGMTLLEPSAGHGAIINQVPTSLDIGPVLCEIDPKKCEILKKDYGSLVVNMDFMGEFAEQYGTFSRILMNPPFTKQQDIDHVLHAYKNCLEEGGRLVAIMSPGFTFRQNKKSEEFKKLVEEHGYWEALPPETFKESGTMVNTVLVVLNK